MRCDEVQTRLEEQGGGRLPEELREHVAGCPVCREFAKQNRWVQAGLRVLAAEAVPEPSWGFGERLLRRWDEAQTQDHSMEVFFEQAGRRFILGTLVLTLLLLIALILPPSSPLREASSVDLLAEQPETVVIRPDSIVGGTQPETVEPAPAKGSAAEVQGQK